MTTAPRDSASLPRPPRPSRRHRSARSSLAPWRRSPWRRRRVGLKLISFRGHLETEESPLQKKTRLRNCNFAKFSAVSIPIRSLSPQSVVNLQAGSFQLARNILPRATKVAVVPKGLQSRQSSDNSADRQRIGRMSLLTTIRMVCSSLSGKRTSRSVPAGESRRSVRTVRLEEMKHEYVNDQVGCRTRLLPCNSRRARRRRR